MAHLEFALLSPIRLMLDRQPIEHFESNKVRALIAFLVVEHQHPHSRDVLAELLWPERGREPSRGNFRRSLANLRSVLGDRNAGSPYLLITRETVQFNIASDVTVDVVRFLELVKTPDTHPAWLDNLEQAVALYRNPFLEGFHLDDCPEFELWMTSVRCNLEQLAIGAFCQLAQYFHFHADFERALPLYRHYLALNPYNEAVQRGFMLALIANGQRGSALAHFTAYCRELREDLGAEPEAQTVKLFTAIQRGAVHHQRTFKAVR